MFDGPLWFEAVFGPYILDEVGGTGRNGAKPVWEFGTFEDYDRTLR